MDQLRLKVVVVAAVGVGGGVRALQGNFSCRGTATAEAWPRVALIQIKQPTIAIHVMVYKKLIKSTCLLLFKLLVHAFFNIFKTFEICV
jgi:hypothetical protein